MCNYSAMDQINDMKRRKTCKFGAIEVPCRDHWEVLIEIIPRAMKFLINVNKNVIIRDGNNMDKFIADTKGWWYLQKREAMELMRHGCSKDEKQEWIENTNKALAAIFDYDEIRIRTVMIEFQAIHFNETEEQFKQSKQFEAANTNAGGGSVELINMQDTS